MTFHDAQQQLDLLLAQCRQGTLSNEAFTTAVNALRVTDAEGRCWQPDPHGPGWLYWDGAAWQHALPPHQEQAAPPSSAAQIAPATPTLTFADAQQQLDALRAQHQQGQISSDALTTAVNALRVTDAEGRCWQPDPHGPGWLYWDGAAWQQALPPHQTSAGVPSTSAQEMSPQQGGLGELTAGIKQHVLAQADNPQAFLQTARILPLRQRPESWWNALSIFGGAISGYFWFVYGSVSGLPTPAFLDFGPLSKYTRFLIPLVLLLVPIFMMLFRQRAASLLTAVQRKFGSLGLVGKIAVFAVPLGLYYFLPGFSNLITRVPFLSRFSFLRINFGEGLDIITPLMMAGLPMAFIYLRRPLDEFLSRITFLQKIPAPLRIGIGLSMPFLTAFLLYILGFTQYPLLRANVLLGTVSSYLFMRTPRLFSSSGKPPQIPALPVVLLLLGLAVLVLCLADPALADCFLTDPFNFNDGLRTNGVAPILAGVATSTVAILVNGVEVAKVIFQDTAPPKEGEDPAKRNFSVQVRTVDAKGQPSTMVREGDTGVVYLYAYCMNESGAFPDGDATIVFPLDLGAPGLTINDLGTQYQQRCACIAMPSPVQGGIPPTVTVTVTAGHGSITIPVTLQVDAVLTLGAEMINANKSYGVKRDFPVFEAWTPDNSPTWTFTEFVTYFHLPTNTEPTKPGFIPAWEAPVISPDYLELTPLSSDDDNLTWRCKAKMKDSVVVPEDWLVSDGVITVTFTCTPTPLPGGAAVQSATPYTAKFGLHLPPMVELACRFDVDKQKGREYSGVKMEQNQFLTDANDELGLIFFPHNRTDKDDPESIAEYDIEGLEYTFEDNAKRDFSLMEDTEFNEPGQKRYKATSNTVMLHDPALPTQITITAKAKIRPKTGDTSKTSDITGKVVLKPGYIYLKLWVVGGGARNTSEASCYACMAPLSSHPLTDFTLMLKVETIGSASLTLDGADRVATDRHGIAKWVLRYSGLTWDTYIGARFDVRCGVPLDNDPPEKCTEVQIDVYNNVMGMLEWIADHQDLMELNNQQFHMLKINKLLPLMSGPWTNMRSCIYKDWDAYICGRYSSRIFGFLATRRFGSAGTLGNPGDPGKDPDPWRCMNGIEINEYAMWFLGPISHHFAGFHLSGTTPLDSPRFIDPWWYQKWDDPAYKTVNGLFTKNTERLLLVKFIAAFAVFSVLAIKAFVVTGLVASPSILYTMMGVPTGEVGLGMIDLTFGDVWEYGPSTKDFKPDGRYEVYQALWAEHGAAHLQTTQANVPAIDPVTYW